jgi:hypothetical protein
VRALRFGVGDAGGTSRLWIVKTTAAVPHVVVTRERIGGMFHVSYKGGAYGHVKVLWRGREHTRALAAIPEVAPGFRRLVRIDLPTAAARFHAALPIGAVVVPPSAEPEEWGVFDVVLEPAGASIATWPGSTTGTSLIGRLDTADGGRVCVVHHLDAGVDGEYTATGVPTDEKAAAVAAVAAGTAYVHLLGTDGDGTLTITELWSHPRSS